MGQIYALTAQWHFHPTHWCILSGHHMNSKKVWQMPLHYGHWKVRARHKMIVNGADSGIKWDLTHIHRPVCSFNTIHQPYTWPSTHPLTQCTHTSVIPTILWNLHYCLPPQPSPILSTSHLNLSCSEHCSDWFPLGSSTSVSWEKRGMLCHLLSSLPILFHNESLRNSQGGAWEVITAVDRSHQTSLGQTWALF